MADMNTNGLSVGEEQAQEFLAQYVNQAVKGERDRVDNKLDSDYYTKADIETALSQKATNTALNETNANVTACASAIAALQAKDIYFGVYTGKHMSEPTQYISLGYTPKAVLVVTKSGRMGADTIEGGLALLGHPATDEDEEGLTGSITIVDNGFNVSYETNIYGQVYYYIAIKSTNNIVVHE